MNTRNDRSNPGEISRLHSPSSPRTRQNSAPSIVPSHDMSLSTSFPDHSQERMSHHVQHSRYWTRQPRNPTTYHPLPIRRYSPQYHPDPPSNPTLAECYALLNLFYGHNHPIHHNRVSQSTQSIYPPTSSIHGRDYPIILPTDSYAHPTHSISILNTIHSQNNMTAMAMEDINRRYPVHTRVDNIHPVHQNKETFLLMKNPNRPSWDHPGAMQTNHSTHPYPKQIEDYSSFRNRDSSTVRSMFHSHNNSNTTTTTIVNDDQDLYATRNHQKWKGSKVGTSIPNPDMHTFTQVVNNNGDTTRNRNNLTVKNDTPWMEDTNIAKRGVLSEYEHMEDVSGTASTEIKDDDSHTTHKRIRRENDDTKWVVDTHAVGKSRSRSVHGTMDDATPDNMSQHDSILDPHTTHSQYNEHPDESTTCGDRSSFMSFPSVNINDVIFERGGFSANHVGNKIYRQVVKDIQPLYKSVSSRKRKKALVESIMNHITKRHQGKFLNREGIHGEWREIPEDLVRLKISQALRDDRN